MPRYVRAGAKLKCSMGSETSELSAAHPSGPVSLRGGLMASVMDHRPMVNILPFGQCQSLANPAVAAATAANSGRLQKMPCVPNTPSPWIGGKRETLVKGHPALLDNSALLCAYLGEISVKDPAQDSVKDGPPRRPKEVNGREGESAIRELTVKDFAEILEKIEKERGYEAARRYAGNDIDYRKINNLTKRFVKCAANGTGGREKDNDPALMPSRFMLLYGADDEKLREHGNIDRHPDDFADPPRHEISVVNLRRALVGLGYEIDEEGATLDDTAYHAFLQYLSRYRAVNLNRVDDESGDGGDDPDDPQTDRLAEKYGLASWRYFCRDGKGGGEHGADHSHIVEELNGNYGDELLAEKGANARDYKPGVCYRYPWVPFSMTLDNGKNHEEGSDNGGGAELHYEIVDRRTLTLLAEGGVKNRDKVEMLLPDAAEILVFIDGKEMELS